ncbi:hypothetical protein BB558_003219 [Smittium angustum]|uniref:SCP domain-containing protein n=1 Tax=Smittium angustum TaxID=133377 RepID=A0A2U1J6M4_SMIAN|nr:hypothetical protein BB558_003219 [Smittium angustum]
MRFIICFVLLCSVLAKGYSNGKDRFKSEKNSTLKRPGESIVTSGYFLLDKKSKLFKGDVFHYSPSSSTIKSAKDIVWNTNLESEDDSDNVQDEIVEDFISFNSNETPRPLRKSSFWSRLLNAGKWFKTKERPVTSFLDKHWSKTDQTQHAADGKRCLEVLSNAPNSGEGAKMASVGQCYCGYFLGHNINRIQTNKNIATSAKNSYTGQIRNNWESYDSQSGSNTIGVTIDCTSNQNVYDTIVGWIRNEDQK